MQISDKYCQWYALSSLAWEQQQELARRRAGQAPLHWADFDEGRLERSIARLRRVFGNNDEPEIWEPSE